MKSHFRACRTVLELPVRRHARIDSARSTEKHLYMLKIISFQCAAYVSAHSARQRACQLATLCKSGERRTVENSKGGAGSKSVSGSRPRPHASQIFMSAKPLTEKKG